MQTQTREPQYQEQFEAFAERGPVRLGPAASHIWRTDPRRLGIVLARYKFCAKMLSGKDRVLEVGCSDGFAIRVVLQEVGSVHGVDFDPLYVEAARAYAEEEGPRCTFETIDIVRERPAGTFDAAYSLDVIEHIPAEYEHDALANIATALDPDGACLVGTPNVTATPYASRWSQEGHVNMKSGESLRVLMAAHFRNVVLFSMNDEVVHTGFTPMAHYLLAMGIGPRA